MSQYILELLKEADTSAYRNFKGVMAKRFREHPGEMKAYLQLALEEFAKDGDTEALERFT